MASERTDQPIGKALPKILESEGRSLRWLATAVGRDVSTLSRGLSGDRNKQVPDDLVVEVRQALGLPAGYFVEEREAFVIACVRRDANLRDRLYNELRRR